MNQPETATSVRCQQAERDLARRVRSSEGEIQQAEAIARHYVAHAQIARAVFDLIQKHKFETRPMPITRDFISTMIATIKANHAKDFGIELEWPKPEPSQPCESHAVREKMRWLRERDDLDRLARETRSS